MSVLKLTGKVSDRCNVTLVTDLGIFEHEGYVPENIGIGGGDYIEMDIDVQTGKILNWPELNAEIILSERTNKWKRV